MSSITHHYLTETQCAAITNIALSTLRNQRFERRGIPYVKLNRSVRYSLQDILDYMQAHRIETEEVQTIES